MPQTEAIAQKNDLDLGDNQPVFQFSRMDKDLKIQKAKKLFMDAVSADTAFPKQAKEAFAFDAGHQWTSEQKRIMEQVEGRPALTFNLCRATKDLVLGVEESNRTEAKAAPTEPQDDFLCEVLNDASDKVYDLGGFEAEEDDVKENTTVCGRGFIAIDFMPDPARPLEIKIEALSISPDEIKLDPAGRHRSDLATDRMIFWERWVTLEDFSIRYPKHIKELEQILRGERTWNSLETTGEPDDDEFWNTMNQSDEDADYDRSSDVNFYDKSKGLVRIIHMEYWDTYDRYYGYNPQSGQIEEFEKAKLPILEKLIPNFQYQTILDKRVHWYQFAGDIELYDGPSPIPYDGFSIVPCFAYKDKSGKVVTHYGITKDIIDPQREVNKRISQTLNLLMQQSQGGYFVESDAYSDKAQFEDSMKTPGATTVVTSGALGAGKIKEKNLPQFPAASFHMFEAAQNLIKQISGVNPDLLGLDSGRQEPGIVVRLRQQQGIVLLSRLFKSFKTMQKGVKERVFAIIMKYMPDSQLQRILGENDRYVFQQGMIVDKENGLVAPLRNLRDLRYNVKLEDSPTNMTKMMAQLAIFIDLMSKGFPTDPKVVIEKLDLPASEKMKWLKYIEGQQQQQTQMAMVQIQTDQQEKQARLQIEQGKLQIEAKKTDADIVLEAKRLEEEALNNKRDYALDLAALDMDDQKMVSDLIMRLANAKQGQKEGKKGNASPTQP